MFYVSDIYRTEPVTFDTALEEKTYQTLRTLHIPYERVETDEAITMEDCLEIDKKLSMKMVKTLFLCNRQQTAFYLFVTAGNKPFRSKHFSAALGISRVSFAPAQLLSQMLGVKIGAATIFSTLLDTDHAIQIVIDKDVLTEKWYGCSDGTTTGYIKIKTQQIIHTFLPYSKHTPTIIEV